MLTYKKKLIQRKRKKSSEHDDYVKAALSLGRGTFLPIKSGQVFGELVKIP